MSKYTDYMSKQMKKGLSMREAAAKWNLKNKKKEGKNKDSE